MNSHLLRAMVLTPLLLAAVCSSVAQNRSRIDRGFERVVSSGDGELSSEEISRFAHLESLLTDADQDGNGLVSNTEHRKAMVRELRQPLSPSTGRLEPGDSLRMAKVDESERRDRIHIPKSYDSCKTTPDVLAFHGGVPHTQACGRKNEWTANARPARSHSHHKHKWLHCSLSAVVQVRRPNNEHRFEC